MPRFLWEAPRNGFLFRLKYKTLRPVPKPAPWTRPPLTPDPLGAASVVTGACLNHRYVLTLPYTPGPRWSRSKAWRNPLAVPSFPGGQCPICEYAWFGKGCPLIALMGCSAFLYVPYAGCFVFCHACPCSPSCTCSVSYFFLRCLYRIPCW